MERWENRYAHGRSGAARNVEHNRLDRVKNLLLILMAVALLGVGIAGGQAIAFRNRGDDTLIARMQNECALAVGLAQDLSRSGGSDTAAILGRIRANVHAVDVVNELHNTLYGSYCVPMNHFTNLYSVINSYSSKLKNGSAIIEEQTNLVNGLTELQTLVQALN